MFKNNVNVLVTDLDNTLWDWFELWYSGFKPFFDALVKQLGIDESILKSQIKAVHQKNKTSEYSLLLQELPCVTDSRPKGFDPYVEFSQAIDAYKMGRKNASRLYPSICETLRTIRGAGTRIIGFTESQFFYTTQRIRTLGLDGLIDVLYTTQDRGLPPIDELRNLRRKPDSYYELQITVTKQLPLDARKPDPNLLLTILTDVGAVAEEAIYIGDNLFKDVAMANEAGVCSVHAIYGEAHRDSRYDLLRDVTHWTPDDVAKERNAKAEGIRPCVEINSFSELLQHFEFQEFLNERSV